MVIKNEDNMREIADRLSETRAPISEHTDVRDWYKPLLSSLIEERRKIPKADRLKQFRNDSVDEIDTTDLENFAFRGMTAREYEQQETGENYDENNPIDVMDRKLQ